ncbi:MAG: hypothetical protein C6W58_12510 [Bacillaceae bacterium]|uniref:Uncharacterized protein n=1 Tax=Aeribacillus pallidus TaxID=33936 RepID=A0A167YYV9_9BACI|nr:hypothetical protein AP3564_05195 [Aeribacillus pallidus]AXI40384.1 hypothetical protein CX649_12355 [Bacillaceae bacterium ZC4]REJ14544.1 MAG: hypothetical protein C6W58_12510 [Bacillaceae bacterium]ASS89755.1 hypothetical protein AP3564_05430 [Aeribacillus pallidus]ASS91060.1 hypothetical protein AP3564_13240 [Aeribacillus pallidus]
MDHGLPWKLLLPAWGKPTGTACGLDVQTGAEETDFTSSQSYRSEKSIPDDPKTIIQEHCEKSNPGTLNPLWEGRAPPTKATTQDMRLSRSVSDWKFDKKTF